MALSPPRKWPKIGVMIPFRKRSGLATVGPFCRPSSYAHATSERATTESAAPACVELPRREQLFYCSFHDEALEELLEGRGLLHESRRSNDRLDSGAQHLVGHVQLLDGIRNLAAVLVRDDRWSEHRDGRGIDSRGKQARCLRGALSLHVVAQRLHRLEHLRCQRDRPEFRIRVQLRRVDSRQLQLPVFPTALPAFQLLRYFVDDSQALHQLSAQVTGSFQSEAPPHEAVVQPAHLHTGVPLRRHGWTGIDCYCTAVLGFRRLGRRLQSHDVERSGVIQDPLPMLPSLVCGVLHRLRFLRLLQAPLRADSDAVVIREIQEMLAQTRRLHSRDASLE
eukprot:scaffold1954_cov268-Pinguiococcus_pyrenoidosus.AAC.129